MMLTLGQIGLPGLFANGSLAAAGAAAVSIPIAIHLLSRMRRKRQVWAAMRFLQEAFRQQKHKLQLEQLLLLIIRCLAILALSMALAGPQMSSLGALASGSDRLVCLVLDDSLSSQALVPGGGTTQRFDDLRATAKKIAQSMKPGDRVGLWLAGRPGQMLLAPSVLDLAGIEQRIDSLKPRFSRSDLSSTLAMVEGSLEKEHVAADRALVIVVSDLSATSLDLDHPAPAEVPKLLSRAKLFLARPATESVNVQIAEVHPRRRLVIMDPSHPQLTSIPIEVKVQRFGAEQAGALTSLRLSVFTGGSDKPVSTLPARELHWAAGQSQASLNVEMPLGAAGEGRAVIQAMIDAGGHPDSLSVDDQRWSVIEVRKRIRVGLIDETDQLVPTDKSGDPTAAQWLTWALAPDPAGGTVEPVNVAAGSIEGGSLAKLNLDAAMVLRPDQLTPGGWDAIKKMAQGGGLVWFFVPPVEGAQQWTSHFKDKLGLPWQVGMDPLPPKPMPEGWSMATDAPPPAPLQMLGSDWGAMQVNMRVQRRLDVQAPGGSQTAWMKLADGNPLLVSGEVGDGRVLLLATALNMDWTNLPAKPLIVSLLHETLRGILGQNPEATREAEIVCGDRPILDSSWSGVDQLVLEPGKVLTSNLTPTDHGTIELSQPLDRPGIYAASPPTRGLRLAVNVDAAGGNTLPIDMHALGEWLGPEGRWHWLDVAHPEEALVQNTSKADLGWPLLWVTLGLLLLETFLARWLSHAQATHQPSLLSLVGRLWKGAGI